MPLDLPADAALLADGVDGEKEAPEPQKAESEAESDADSDQKGGVGVLKGGHVSIFPGFAYISVYDMSIIVPFGQPGCPVTAKMALSPAERQRNRPLRVNFAVLRHLG